MAPFLVDDEIKLHALLTLITKNLRAKQDQLMFVDLEGVNLGRSGTIAIMQLLMPPSPVVYLIDVHRLEAKAFDLTTADGTSLQSVLESPNIFKVFFDIRNDSDALHAHFGVNVARIIDLQIVEYAARNPRGKYVNGLAKCIEKDLPHIPGWSFTKAHGRRLFAPEAGGRYEVFLERPVADEILKYCEQDVMLMPRLLALYGGKLQAGVAAQLQGIVDERIRLSKTDTYNGQGRHMAVGPPLAPTRYLNISTSRELELVRSARLADMCRLDESSIDDLSRQFHAVEINATEAPPLAQETSSLTPVTSPSVLDDVNTSPTSSSPPVPVAEAAALPEATTPAHSVSLEEITKITQQMAQADIGAGLQGDGQLPVEEDNDNDNEDEDESSLGSDGPEYDPLVVPSGGYLGASYFDGGSDNDKDFTACSRDYCGWCGHCDY